MAQTAVELILDLLLPVLRRQQAERHLGIEVALALEMIEQIAAAFDQQVAVDGAFLIDGDEAAQGAFGDLGAGGGELHFGAGVEVEARCDGVFFLVVFELFEGDARQQQVGVLIGSADTFNAGTHAAFGDQVPTKAVENQAPMAGTDGAFDGVEGLAAKFYAGEPGAFASVDLEVDAGFLRSDNAFHGVSDFRLVEAVGAEAVDHVFDGGFGVIIHELGAELELRRAGELAFVGRLFGAEHANLRDEEGGRGGDDELDALIERFGFDLDIGEATG